MDNNIICSIKTKDIYGTDKVLFFTDYWIDNQLKYYFYCPKCKTFEPIIIDYKVKKDNLDLLNEYEGSIFCSTCNAEYNSKDYTLLHYDEYNSIFLRYMTVFDNKDNTIVLKFGINKTMFTKKGPRFCFATQRLKINIENGNSYIFEPWINNKRAFFYKGPKIANCSYGLGVPYIYNSLPLKALQLINNFIYSKKKELLGYNLPTLQQYHLNWYANKTKTIYKDINLTSILTYNRIPNLNSFNLSNLINYKVKIKNKFNNTISKIKTYSNNPLKELLEKLNLPYTKSLKKVANENYCSLYVISFFNNILDNIKYSINLEKLYNCFTLFYNKDAKDVSKFIKTILKQRGTKKTYIFLFNTSTKHNNSYLLVDTAKMYTRILKYNKNHKRKINVDLSGNLKKIHDYLSSIVNKLATKKVYFKYPEEDKEKINYKEKGYEIKLTTNTHQLKDIGTYMNICVGSYDRRVLNHNCRIAILTKDKKYITCIELDYELKKVLQTKMKYNELPSGEIKKILLNWIDRKKLLINTSDIQNNIDFIEGEMNYEQYNI